MVLGSPIDIGRREKKYKFYRIYLYFIIYLSGDVLYTVWSILDIMLTIVDLK
jgi:hypothetical protein